MAVIHVAKNRAKKIEMELKLTCKFNQLVQIHKASGLLTDYYRCAKFQKIVYHCGGHIYQYGTMYKVEL